ncbi:MAG: exodeoxyribonuclease VII large subunit [Candidatus Wallbacteria bacterium]|nr:exodeoxyribonuclease VII large subunit [Candidatus Wallbacteria bacterium]
MIPGRENTSAEAEHGFLSVTEITAYLKGLIGSNPFLSRLSVAGEVTGLTRHGSGHIYFSLKDENALIRCVFFRGQQRETYSFLNEGARVIVRGELGVFEKRGEYQVYVKELLDFGRGNILLKLQKLKEELERKGYFAAERKRALPEFPSRIGIVTAKGGAALQDMLKVFRGKAFGLQVFIADSRVQGDGAAAEIAGAIRLLNRIHQLDLIIVARGGGSLEDLWCFNEMPVVESVFSSACPVVSAVGHEVDFTLVDFVADVRAATPTQAAELAVRHRDELEKTIRGDREKICRKIVRTITDRQQWLDNMELRLKQDIQGRLHRHFRVLERFTAAVPGVQQAFHRIESRLLLLSPCRWPKVFQLSFLRQRSQLENCLMLLKRYPENRLKLLNQRLEFEHDKLSLLNPDNVLKRGYAVIMKDGKPVKRAAGIAAGDKIGIKFSDGKKEAEVLS